MCSSDLVMALLLIDHLAVLVVGLAIMEGMVVVMILVVVMEILVVLVSVVIRESHHLAILVAMIPIWEALVGDMVGVD